MAGLQITTPPANEPVSLQQAKDFLRVSTTDDDSFIGDILIPAAREAVESFTNRSLCTKTYLQTLDSFPYYTDSARSQDAMPPSYWSLPRYGAGMWNYSQMIKLYAASPVVVVSGIDYTKTDGTTATLHQDTDFVVDTVSEPARIFPMPGSMWPPNFYVPNAVRITFTSGYSADASLVPGRAKIAMLQFIAHWYENREAAMLGSFGELPNHIQMLLWSLRVMDLSPTRG